MSTFFRGALVLTAAFLTAAAAQAQTVGMAGQYHETNGIIINIPQNPPVVDCDNTVNDSRCLARVQKFFGFTVNQATNKPEVGVKGARLVNGGLNAGDQFTIPPLFFGQRLGQQTNIVLNAVGVRQLDTTFTAAMPPTSRAKNPNAAGTRRFRANDWSLPGNNQNNGETGTAFVARPAANFAYTRTIPNETLTMTYTAGPNAFGGTAGILLDGRGRLYLAGAVIDQIFIDQGFPSLAPIVGTNPVGDGVPGFATRNAVGYEYTVPGGQASGQFRGYGFEPVSIQNLVIAPECSTTTMGAIVPAGCNEINDFDLTTMGGQAPPQGNGTGPRVYGVPAGPLPGATSNKFMFPWTTGFVSIVRTAVRNGNTQTDTVTGMGYDTTVMSTGGAVTQRNVGMIAGSYTIRTDVAGTNMNTQMAGMNLKFTPEPGATVALVSGLGLLAGLAVRRRR